MEEAGSPLAESHHGAASQNTGQSRGGRGGSDTATVLASTGCRLGARRRGGIGVWGRATQRWRLLAQVQYGSPCLLDQYFVLILTSTGFLAENQQFQRKW